MAIITSLIVAMTEEGVIGRNGVMPWRIPEEMAYFRRKTMGYPVIMGRKTYESIGRLLPGRMNIVITRNPKYKKKSKPQTGLLIVNSLAEAIDWCDGEYVECFIIGGGQIYKEALDLDVVDRMYVSALKYPYKGDTYFPDFDVELWNREIVKETYDEFQPLIFVRKKDYRA